MQILSVNYGDRDGDFGENHFDVYLPNSRSTINIVAPGGADALIGAESNFCCFSSLVQQVDDIRNQCEPLTKEQKGNIKSHYMMLKLFAQNASPKAFKLIPASEIECWFDHAINMLQFFSTSPRYIMTGVLDEHELYILKGSCSLVSHVKALDISFKKGFLKEIANFLAAPNAPLMPSAEIADSIFFFVYNVKIMCEGYKVQGEQWNSEKFWNFLESTGLLLQFIRTSTIPQPNGDDPDLFVLYDDIIKCLPVLKKKFKRGKPCGDAVRKILSGEDGSRVEREKVLIYLSNLTKMVDAIQPNSSNTFFNMSSKMCRYCSKPEDSEDFEGTLMKCSRCKNAYYCSKECQKKDWKMHKKFCMLADKQDKKNKQARANAAFTFLDENYTSIMEKFIEVIDMSGKSREDFLLELDFFPGENGCAPALKDPPEFNIKDIRGYIEGNRPNLPDWFPVNYEVNASNTVQMIRAQHQRMTPDHLLCLVRTPSCGLSAYRILLRISQFHEHNKFSNETIKAYKKAWKEGDFGPLSEIFGAQNMPYFRMKIGK